jgi:thiol:disulfide interchange protein DsbC
VLARHSWRPPPGVVEDRLRARSPASARDGLESITKLPELGLYEVVSNGNRIFYTDAKGDFGLVGNLIDLKTRVNLTQQRQEELNVVDFGSLPLDKAIVKVKGDGSRKLAIFTDPDCPFCKRLEHELAKVSNVTVYVFLLPLPQLHPDAPRKARAVWCSADRAKAWDALMLEGKEPAAPGPECKDPIADVAKVASDIGIQGTPGLAFVSGKLVPGAIGAEQIEQYLNAPGKAWGPRRHVPIRPELARMLTVNCALRTFRQSRRRAPVSGSRFTTSGCSLS